MILYLLPNGTDGFVLCNVSGFSLSPCPPARIVVKVPRNNDEPVNDILFSLFVLVLIYSIKDKLAKNQIVNKTEKSKKI